MSAGGMATPGPWSVRLGVCRNDHPDTSPDVHGPQGQFVANCGCHEQANANAALIAVAPEMADMLYAQWELEHCEDEACAEHGALIRIVRAIGRLP